MNKCNIQVNNGTVSVRYLQDAGWDGGRYRWGAVTDGYQSRGRDGGKCRMQAKKGCRL